ncbi:fibulin-1-like isoform X2 [Melanotaenia boesemani]|nr:fibulin-1-like isoform X2 [Melanotaenia boesemani]
MALRGQNCTVSLQFTSLICSIAEEQCCRSVAGHKACNDGIKIARDQGACDRLFFSGSSWETHTSQMCCDCCAFGLMAAQMGLSCEISGLQLGKQCTNTAKTCCEEPQEVKPTEEGTQESDIVTFMPPKGTKTCRDSTCTQLCVGNGVCACHEGFQLKTDGVTCEDVDECLTGSHNCAPGHVCLNTEGSFRCQSSCGTGFLLTDDNICKDIDECALGSHHCEGDLVCMNTVGSFHCNQNVGCGDGYIQGTSGSCVDINECVAHPSPCQRGQTCINTVGSYSCYSNTVACDQGYHLNVGGTHCEDVNECLIDSHNCAPGQVCINTEGSFYCQRETSCGTGYKLSENSSCQDIDECVLGTHHCGEDFVCINTVGSYRCHSKEGCGDGYIQDAAGNCIDINECVAHPSPCGPGQTCINSVGSYNCRINTVTCARGYHLNADGSHCEDVNECLTGNLCGSHGCVNLEGSYRCECRPGFMFNRISKLCEDVNECRHYPGRLCAHKCENTEGSYHCSCATGFKLAHDGRNCEDVDECEHNPCSQECANVYGSFQCYCHRGYQLSDIDGKTCQDIDECALPNVCSYLCLNTLGGFNCTCPPSGYTLANDGRTCQDIDECAAGTHTCSASESCFNVQGGFRCLFIECPPNFRRAAVGSSADASVIVRCIKACQGHDTACNHNPVHLITSTVLSLPTFRHFRDPEEIVFLRTAVAAKPASLSDEPDVYFEILATDDQNSFDVVKRSHHGMIVGVIRQLKPVIGPRELVLEVTMNYVQSGTISQQNIVIIHVFISEFWF